MSTLLPERLIAASESFLSLLRYPRYADEIRAMLLSNAHNPETWLDLAFHLLEEKHPRPARDILLTLEEALPARVKVRKLLGDTYWQERDAATAARWYDAALATAPSEAYESFLQGGIARRRLDHARAAGCYLDALDGPAPYADAERMLRQLLQTANPAVRAELQRRHVAGCRQAGYWLGVAAFDAGDDATAEPLLLAMLPTVPPTAAVWEQLAHLYRRQGSLARLEQLLAQREAQGLPLPAAWLTALAEDHAQRGEYLTALRLCRRAGAYLPARRFMRLLALNPAVGPQLIRELGRSPRRADRELLCELHRLRGNLQAALAGLRILQQQHPEPARQESIDRLQLVLRLRDEVRLLQFRDRWRQSPWQQLLERLGTATGQYAFRGPWKVELKLTNRCNNNCLGCTYRSPLLQESTTLPEWQKQELPLPIVLQFIDDLAALGTKVIRLSGGGEPLLYPRIEQVLARMQARHIAIELITNGTMLTPMLLKQLADMHVYGVGVSLWAATDATYRALHPNRQPDDFQRIIDTLATRHHLFAAGRPPFCLSLINVLNRLNCHEVHAMYDLARQLRATCIHYTMMLPLAYETDSLLPTPEQLGRLRDDLLAIRAQARQDGIALFSIDELLHALGAPQATHGAYAVIESRPVPCTVGWTASFVNADGTIYPCAEGQCVPLGNICQDSFPEIWNSPAYRRFRAAAYAGRFATGDVFSGPRCWEKCDHHGDENARYYEEWFCHGRLRIMLHDLIGAIARHYR